MPEPNSNPDQPLQGRYTGQLEVFGHLSAIPGVALVLGFWGAFGLGIAAIFSANVRSWWVNWWPEVVGVFAASAILLIIARRVEKWLARASEETTRKFATMFAIPTIAFAIVALFALGASQVALASQVILILVTALLPATTYYLFLATRRPSILNEYIANLSRLGLLSIRVDHVARPQLAIQPAVLESREEYRVRVEGYFQRFEAIYGMLRFESSGPPITRRDLVDQLTEAVRGSERSARLPQPEMHIGDIFNANLIIPIGLVTVLCALGWLLVLQPDLNAIWVEKEVADLVPKQTPLNFAFLGAYFFGVQMLFRRFVRRDLGPNAFMAFANRIILALIGVWLVVAVYPASSEVTTSNPSTAPAAASSAQGALNTTTTEGSKSAEPQDEKQREQFDGKAKAGSQISLVDKSIAEVSAAVNSAKATLTVNAPAALLVLAFVIGVFPRVLWQFLSAAVTKLLRIKLLLPSIEAKQPLNELDGLTVWHETRLEEEDVERAQYGQRRRYRTDAAYADTGGALGELDRSSNPTYVAGCRRRYVR